MLKYISLIIFLPSLILSAQIPTGYYDSALGLADGDLKYALNQIIDNHTEFSYTSSSIDVSGVGTLLGSCTRLPMNAAEIWKRT